MPRSEPAPVMRATRPAIRNGRPSVTESGKNFPGHRLSLAQRVGFRHDHDQLGEPCLTEALDLAQEQVYVVTVEAELDGQADLGGGAGQRPATAPPPLRPWCWPAVPAARAEHR